MDTPLPPAPRHRFKWKWFVAIAAGVMAVAFALRLEAAAPKVPASSIVLSTVERGMLVRQVRGPGKLIPEQIRWVPSIVPGRVERRLVVPGARVKSNTTLIELSNPELELELLEAQSDLASARASLVDLRTRLAARNLAQEAVVASSQALLHNAARSAESANRLEPEGLISRLEAATARALAADLDAQLEIERRRLLIFSGATPDELSVQQIQVRRLERVVEAHKARIASLRITAGMDGVLQDLSVEEGQWVQPGATVARIIEPEHLKALVRIPQIQANEVAVGQPAIIDTRNATIHGQVARIDPAVQDGVVNVEIALKGKMPQGIRPDLSVDAIVEVERLADVLQVDLPSAGRSHGKAALFRLEDEGMALRTQVVFGRASIRKIEVVDGLEEGDIVILSDMAQWASYDRLRLR